MDYGARFTVGNTIFAYGDSFTLGMGASDQAHWYINLLAAYCGSPVNNQGVSGTGTTQAANAVLATTSLPRKSGAAILSGFNDIGRGGAAAIPKIKSNHRAMLAALFLRDAVPASAAPRISGQWNPVGSTVGGLSFAHGGTPMYSDDVGAYLEFDFYGETLVVGAYTQTTCGTYSDLNISVDGCAVTVLQSLALNDEAYPATGHNVAIFRGLGVGKHTAHISSVNNGSHCVVDYIGTLVDPAAAAGVLVGGVPTRVNWTYNGFTTDQAATDQASAVINAAVDEFSGYPVRFVPVNDFYSAAGVWTDGYHPSDHGHCEIFQAFRSRVSLVP